MLIFVQYPIADFRLFFEASTGRLNSPLWPSPKPYHEFVRSFGIVRKRGKGGIQGWIGENEICNAKHIIKFKNPIIIDIAKGDDPSITQLGLKCASRHFYFDGEAVAKFELVFVTIPNLVQLSRKTFVEFFMNFLGTRAKIPISKTDLERSTVQNLGKLLSGAYLRSTTQSKFVPTIDYKNWAKAGDPLFWVEFNQDEELPLPIDARYVPTKTREDVALYHWNPAPQKNNPMNVWLVKRQADPQTGSALSRTARIMLTRLSAEQEVFWAVLHMVNKEMIGQEKKNVETQSVDYLQHYFNESTRRIFRLKKSKELFFEPNEVGSSVRASLEFINPGRTNSLLQKLDLLRIRPQVADKIKQIIQIFITENVIGDKVFGNRVIGTIVEGDQYNIGNATAVGPGAQANNTNMISTNEVNLNVDMNQLAKELHLLHKEMLLSTDDSNHADAVKQVEIAENAAKKGNKTAVLSSLVKAGEWTLNIAEKIGTAVAVSAIKSALGV